MDVKFGPKHQQERQDRAKGRVCFDPFFKTLGVQLSKVDKISEIHFSHPLNCLNDIRVLGRLVRLVNMLPYIICRQRLFEYLRLLL